MNQGPVSRRLLKNSAFPTLFAWTTNKKQRRKISRESVEKRFKYFHSVALIIAHMHSAVILYFFII